MVGELGGEEWSWCRRELRCDSSLDDMAEEGAEDVEIVAAGVLDSECCCFFCCGSGCCSCSAVAMVVLLENICASPDGSLWAFFSRLA